MTFGSRGYVSIVELIVYIPAFALALFVCIRHGFARSSGWMYTLILCLARVIGAILQLVTYSKPSVGLYTAVFTIDALGISPLLLATLGMLSRLYVSPKPPSPPSQRPSSNISASMDWINTKKGPVLNAYQFRLLQLLVLLGMILGIVGATSATSSDGTYTPQATSKAGSILYLVAFILMMLVLVLCCLSLSYVPRGERKIAFAVAFAAPFIFVRLIYSLIAVVANNKTFRPGSGSVVVFALMSVLEEIFAVIIYLVLGFTLEKLQESDKGELANRSANKNKRSHGRRSHARRVQEEQESV